MDDGDELYERADFGAVDPASAMVPGVEEAANALGEGPSVVVGWSNWTMARFVRVVSRRRLARLLAGTEG